MGIVTGMSKGNGTEFTSSIVTRSSSSGCVNDESKETLVLTVSSDDDSDSECECKENCTCDGAITVSDSSDEVGEGSCSQSSHLNESNTAFSLKNRLYVQHSKSIEKKGQRVSNLHVSPTASVFQVDSHKIVEKSQDCSEEVGSVLTGSKLTKKDVPLIDVEPNTENRWASVNKWATVTLNNDDEIPEKTPNNCYIPFISENLINNTEKLCKNSDEEPAAHNLINKHLNCEASDVIISSADPGHHLKMNLSSYTIPKIKSNLVHDEFFSSSNELRKYRTSSTESSTVPTPISDIKYEIFTKESSTEDHLGCNDSVSLETEETRNNMNQPVERNPQFLLENCNENKQDCSQFKNGSKHSARNYDTYEFTETDEPLESVAHYSYYTEEYKSNLNKQKCPSNIEANQIPMYSREDYASNRTFTRNAAPVCCYTGKSPPRSSKTLTKTSIAGVLRRYSKRVSGFGMPDEKSSENILSNQISSRAHSSHDLLCNGTSKYSSNHSQGLLASQIRAPQSEESKQLEYDLGSTTLEVMQDPHKLCENSSGHNDSKKKSKVNFYNFQGAPILENKSSRNSLIPVQNTSENVTTLSEMTLHSSEQLAMSIEHKTVTHESNNPTSTSQSSSQVSMVIRTENEVTSLKNIRPQQCFQENHTSSASPDLFAVVNGDVAVNAQKKLILEGEKVSIGDLLQYFDDDSWDLEESAIANEESTSKATDSNAFHMKDQILQDQSSNIHQNYPAHPEDFCLINKGSGNLSDPRNLSSDASETGERLNFLKTNHLNLGCSTPACINQAFLTCEQNVHSVNDGTAVQPPFLISLRDTDEVLVENAASLPEELHSHQSSSLNAAESPRNRSLYKKDLKVIQTCVEDPESEHCDGHLDRETASTNSTDEGVIGSVVSPGININVKQHSDDSTERENGASLVPEPDHDGVNIHMKQHSDDSTDGENVASLVPEPDHDEVNINVKQLSDDSTDGENGASLVPEPDHDEVNIHMKQHSDDSTDGENVASLVPEPDHDEVNINVKQLSDDSTDGENVANLVPEPDYDGVVLYCHGTVLCSQARVRPDGFTLYHVFERFEEGCGCRYYPSAQQIVDSEKPLQTMIDKVLCEVTGECCCEEGVDKQSLDTREALRQQVDGVQIYSCDELQEPLTKCASPCDSLSSFGKNEPLSPMRELTRMMPPLSEKDCSQLIDESAEDESISNIIEDKQTISSRMEPSTDNDVTGYKISSRMEPSTDNDVTGYNESKEDIALLNTNETVSPCNVSSLSEEEVMHGDKNTRAWKRHPHNSPDLCLTERINEQSSANSSALCDKSLGTVSSFEKSKAKVLTTISSNTKNSSTINRTRASLRSFRLAGASQCYESNSNKQSHIILRPASPSARPTEVAQSLEVTPRSPPTLLSQPHQDPVLRQPSSMTNAVPSASPYENDSPNSPEVLVKDNINNCSDTTESATGDIESISSTPIFLGSFASSPYGGPTNIFLVTKNIPSVPDCDQLSGELSNSINADGIDTQAMEPDRNYLMNNPRNLHSSCDDLTATLQQHRDSGESLEASRVWGSDTEAASLPAGEGCNLGPVSNTSFFRLPQSAADNNGCSRFQLYQFELRFPSIGGCQDVRWRRVMRRMRKQAAVISIDAEEENNKLTIVLHSKGAADHYTPGVKESLSSVDDNGWSRECGKSESLENLNVKGDFDNMNVCDETETFHHIKIKASVLSDRVEQFSTTLGRKCKTGEACNLKEQNKEMIPDSEETMQVWQTREYSRMEKEILNLCPNTESVKITSGLHTMGQQLDGCSDTEKLNDRDDARSQSRNSSIAQDDVSCWCEDDFRFDDEIHLGVTASKEDDFFSKQNSSNDEKEVSTAVRQKPIEWGNVSSSTAKAVAHKQRKAPFDVIFHLLKKIDCHVYLEETYEVQLEDEAMEEMSSTCCGEDQFEDIASADEHLGQTDSEIERDPFLMASVKEEPLDEEFYGGGAVPCLDEIKFALPEPCGSSVMCLCDCKECMEDYFKDDPGDDIRCYCELIHSAYQESESVDNGCNWKEVADLQKGEMGKHPQITKETISSEYLKNSRTGKACASAYCIYKKKNLFECVRIMDIIPLMWCSEGHRVCVRGPFSKSDISTEVSCQEQKRKESLSSSHTKQAVESSKLINVAIPVKKGERKISKHVSPSKLSSKAQKKVYKLRSKEIELKAGKKNDNVSSTKKQKLSPKNIIKDAAQLKRKNSSSENSLDKCTNDSSKKANIGATACELGSGTDAKVISSLDGVLYNKSLASDILCDKTKSLDRKCSLSKCSLSCSCMQCGDKGDQRYLEDIDALPSLGDELEQFSDVSGCEIDPKKSFSFAATTPIKHGNTAVTPIDAAQLQCSESVFDELNEFPLLKQSRTFSPLKQLLTTKPLKEKLDEPNKNLTCRPSAKMTVKVSTSASRRRRKSMPAVLQQNTRDWFNSELDISPQVDSNTQQLAGISTKNKRLATVSKAKKLSQAPESKTKNLNLANENKIEEHNFAAGSKWKRTSLASGSEMIEPHSDAESKKEEPNPASGITRKESKPSARRTVKEPKLSAGRKVKESNPAARRTVEESNPAARRTVKESNPAARRTVKEPNPAPRSTVNEPILVAENTTNEPSPSDESEVSKQGPSSGQHTKGPSYMARIKTMGIISATTNTIKMGQMSASGNKPRAQRSTSGNKPRARISAPGSKPRARRSSSGSKPRARRSSSGSKPRAHSSALENILKVQSSADGSKMKKQTTGAKRESKELSRAAENQTKEEQCLVPSVSLPPTNFQIRSNIIESFCKELSSEDKNNTVCYDKEKLAADSYSSTSFDEKDQGTTANGLIREDDAAVIQNIALDNDLDVHNNRQETVNNEDPSCKGGRKRKTTRVAKVRRRLRLDASLSDTSESLPDDFSSDGDSSDDEDLQAALVKPLAKRRRRKAKALKDFAYDFDDDFYLDKGARSDCDTDFIPDANQGKSALASKGRYRKNRASSRSQKQTCKTMKNRNVIDGQNKKISFANHFINNYMKSASGDLLHLGGGCSLGEDLLSFQGETKPRTNVSSRGRRTVTKSGFYTSEHQLNNCRIKMSSALDKAMKPLNDVNCFNATDDAHGLESKHSPVVSASVDKTVVNETLPSHVRLNQILPTHGLTNIKTELITNGDYPPESDINGREHFSEKSLNEEATLSDGIWALDQSYGNCSNAERNTSTDLNTNNSSKPLLSDDRKEPSGLPSVAACKVESIIPSTTFESSFLKFICQNRSEHNDHSLQTTRTGDEQRVSSNSSKDDVPNATPPSEQVASSKTCAVSKVKIELSERKDIIGDISDIIDPDSNSSSNSNDWTATGGTTFSDMYFKFISEKSADASEDNREESGGLEESNAASSACSHSAKEVSTQSLAAVVDVEEATVAGELDTDDPSVAIEGLVRDASPEVGAPSFDEDDLDLQSSHSQSPTRQEDCTLKNSENVLQDPLALEQKPFVITVDDSDDDTPSLPVRDELNKTSPAKLPHVSSATACSPTEGAAGIDSSPNKYEFMGFQSIPAVHPLVISLASNYSIQYGLSSLMTGQYPRIPSVSGALDPASSSSYLKRSSDSSSMRPLKTSPKYEMSGGSGHYENILPNTMRSRSKPLVVHSGISSSRLQRKQTMKTYDQITCVRLFEAESDTSSVESRVRKVRKRKLSSPQSPRKRSRQRLTPEARKAKMTSPLVENVDAFRLKVARVDVELWTKADLDKVISDSSSSADETLQHESIDNDPKLNLNACVLVEKLDLNCVKRNYDVSLSDFYLQSPAKRSKDSERVCSI